MINRRLTTWLLAILAMPMTAISSYGQVSVLTNHNDNFRTGSNLQETVLNTSNVNGNQFGKLFTQPVDGQIYGQPLYVANVSIPGKGTHNVLYVTTMNDSVYAFDADSKSGVNEDPLWKVNFTNPDAGITTIPAGNVQPFATDIIGPIGIMSTPVIDPSSKTIYVLVRTIENGSYFQRLHALDITTGAEKFGGPVEIRASMEGASGTTHFDPMRNNQRVGLGLANGQVYVVWSSHNDYGTYHGWVLAYDATTLRQTAMFNDTPDGNAGGIWQAGQAPAFDSDGNVYLATGNGSWDGERNFSQSVIKLSPNLSLMDWFTPDNYRYFNDEDLDLGGSGPLLIPNANRLLSGGKPGIFFLLNTEGLGHITSHNTNAVETFLAATGHIHCSPIYWESPTLGPLVYVWGEFDYLKAYHFNGNTLDQQPVSQSFMRVPDGMPGGFLSVTSNGNNAGTGIVWASTPLNGDANHNTVQGILRAFDASDLTHELWNTQQNIARDDIGNFAKNVPPTVANGKVYMATFSNQIAVYGLLSSTSDFSLSSLAPSQTVSPGASIRYPITISDLQSKKFQGTVNFSVSGLPNGASASFSPTSLTDAGSTTLTISAGAETALGTYTFTVNASSGGASHSIQLTLVVGSLNTGEGPGTSRDIGPGTQGSSTTFSNNTYTVKGGGTDIWGTSDQFRFTFWQLNGDGAIVARIVSPANADDYSKSGVMIREMLDSNSSYAFLANTPSMYAFQYRNATGAYSATSGYYSVSYPQWLKVVRSNGNFTGYVSQDGEAWTQVGEPVSIGMAQSVYIGLAACAHASGTLSSATFDNVKYFSVSETSPDFNISTNSNSYKSTILAGNALSLPLTVNALNGFGGTVNFSVSGLPSGAGFTPVSVTGNGTATLSITTAPNTPTGSYPVTIRAISGALVRVITINLSVTNFSLSATPSSQSVTAGGSVSYAIDYHAQNRYNGVVNLTVTGLPAGVTAYFEPNGVDRIVSSTLTLSTSSGTSPGTYNLTIHGASNAQSRATQVQLAVNPVPDFALSVSPESRTVISGASTTYTVTSTAIGGFSGNISLSTQGLPTGATASFSPTSITGSGSSTTTIQTGATTPVGSYPIVVTGSSGSLSHSPSTTLTVTVQNFGTGVGTDVDIANPLHPGSASVDSGVYTIKGSGIDIWWGSDQFNFNYWRMAGDGVLTARLVSQTNTAQYAKAGIMIRQTLNPDSPYAFAVASPTLYSFHYRTATGVYASQGPYLNVTYPIWLRLVRSNGNLTAYSSQDGQNWTQINQTVSINMDGTIYAGLAVTSQNPDAVNTAVFDNLSFTPGSSSTPDFTVTPASEAVQSIASGQSANYTLAVSAKNSFSGPVDLSASELPAGTTAQWNPATLNGSGSSTLAITTSATTPPGWYALTIKAASGALVRTTSVTLLTQNLATGGGTDSDIGNPSMAGSSTQSGGIFTVQGSGSDIWNTSDQFNFNHWQVTGNLTITARVTSITSTDFYAKAGLMIRETLNANSKFAFAVTLPTLFNFHYRSATGENASAGPYFNPNYPIWLRLVRLNGVFTAYSSSDGQTWTKVNTSATISMADTVYVGLAVTSHNVTELNTAVFDNVVITRP